MIVADAGQAVAEELQLLVAHEETMRLDVAARGEPSR